MSAPATALDCRMLTAADEAARQAAWAPKPLRELALQALEASLAQSLYTGDDDDKYATLDDAALDASKAFRERLVADTGITRELFDLLQRDGIL